MNIADEITQGLQKARFCEDYADSHNQPPAAMVAEKPEPAAGFYVPNLRTVEAWMQAIYDLAVCHDYKNRWQEVLKYPRAEDFYIQRKVTIENIQKELLGGNLQWVSLIAKQFREKCELAFRHQSKISLHELCTPTESEEQAKTSSYAYDAGTYFIKSGFASDCAYDIFWHSVIEEPLSFFAQLQKSPSEKAERPEPAGDDLKNKFLSRLTSPQQKETFLILWEKQPITGAAAAKHLTVDSNLFHKRVQKVNSKLSPDCEFLHDKESDTWGLVFLT